MKKSWVIMLIFPLFVFFLMFNIKTNAVAPFEVLSSFEPDTFLTLEDIDITSEELDIIKGYFEKENIISSSNTKIQNHENIFKWIKNNVAYEQSSNRAYDVFLNRKGVCEGYTQLYKVLCYLCGISNVISNGKMGDLGHAWNYVYLDRWYKIDITNHIYDDIFKNDLSHYIDEYLTPYLYKDEDFIYYYSKGVSVKALGSNNNIPSKIKDLNITSLDDYLPHLSKGFSNDLIKELDIPNNIENINMNYFKSFPNLEKVSGKNCQDGIYYEGNNVYIPPKIKVLKINLENVGKEVISNLLMLEEIHFLEATRVIETDSIMNCPKLKKVFFPDKIEEINVSLNDVVVYGDSEVVKTYALEKGLQYGDLLLKEEKKEKINIIVPFLITIGTLFIIVVIFKMIRKKKYEDFLNGKM